MVEEIEAQLVRDLYAAPAESTTPKRPILVEKSVTPQAGGTRKREESTTAGQRVKFFLSQLPLSAIGDATT